MGNKIIRHTHTPVVNSENVPRVTFPTKPAATSPLAASLSPLCIQPISTSPSPSLPAPSSSLPPSSLPSSTHRPEGSDISSFTMGSSDLFGGLAGDGPMSKCPITSRPATSTACKCLYATVVQQPTPRVPERGAIGWYDYFRGLLGIPPSLASPTPATSPTGPKFTVDAQHLLDDEGKYKGPPDHVVDNVVSPQSRGPSQPTVSVISECASAVPPPLRLDSSTPSWRQPRRRAVLVGVSHAKDPESRRLRAGNDPFLVKLTLERREFESKNIVIATDERIPTPRASHKKRHGVVSANATSRPAEWEGSRCIEPTRDDILFWLSWLVDDAQAGDDLVVLFSGHCEYLGATREPCIRTTKGGKTEAYISKTELRDKLLSKVPAGCQLQLILDCCNAASLADLPFRVPSSTHDTLSQLPTPIIAHIDVSPAPATLDPQSPPRNSNPSTSQNPAPRFPAPGRSSAIAVGNRLVAPLAPDTPASSSIAHAGANAVPAVPASPDSLVSSAYTPKRPGGGVASAPPPATPIPARQSEGIFSVSPHWYNLFPCPNIFVPGAPVTYSNAKPTRNNATSMSSPAGSLERLLEGPRLVGNITMWAASGLVQKAFERYELRDGRRYGTLVDAFCATLDETQEVSVQHLKAAIDLKIKGENETRLKRHQKGNRVCSLEYYDQCAELWVSQVDMRADLDKLIFPPRDLGAMSQGRPPD